MPTSEPQWPAKPPSEWPDNWAWPPDWGLAAIKASDCGDFNDFPSSAAILAYTYKKVGAEGVRVMLAMMLCPSPICPTPADREALEKQAEELAAIGLPEIAEIVLEYAAKARTYDEIHRPWALKSKARDLGRR
jgi:hypothetical protein